MERQVFIYCERALDGAFWAEPLNALTNGAFIVAGLATLHLIGRRPAAGRSLADILLAVLMLAIGLGSFLFHTFATPWAAVADTAPIGLFMLLYLGLALYRLFDLPAWGVGLALLGFVGLMAATRLIPCPGGSCLNGSVGYLPALLALAAMGGLLAARRHPAAPGLLVAAGLFALSLTFRSVDRVVCGPLPLGTHFLWHLLNAAVLYVAARTAVLHRTP